MKKFILFCLSIILFQFLTLNVIAQDSKVETKQESKPKAEEKKPAEIQTITKTQVDKPQEVCICQKPVISALEKSYASLEEDEWPAAIKVCTDAQNTIKNLSKTCICLDKVLYGNIAQAFLNYAKGGDILDGEKEPDCVLVTKLYTEAIKLLTESAPKLKDEKFKSNIENIRDYSKEELEFIKDECSSS